MPTTAEINQKYFRPSCLPAINSRGFPVNFFEPYTGKKYNEIVVPGSLLSNPTDMIINFFSLLREANNFPGLPPVGCGSIGLGATPLPVAYHFFSSFYQAKHSYNDFSNLFKNVAHINLIKLLQLVHHNNYYRYFIEIETIQSIKKGVTCFVYYYGFVTVEGENGVFKISDMTLTGEDFLCAAYHGWSHNAEESVAIRYAWCNLIKKQSPAEQTGFIKNIYFLGTDGADYLIQFITLTNGTDIEIAQFRREPNQVWTPIHIDPTKCLPSNQKNT
ncbi:Hypothetical protein LUCI_4789 [Lucifera butyrica]|uniref:Uncharacterized protein n=1 Tax=Lucifera butyrica TaxID=1351585 RepID=A0A498RD64_9FIRM|nr:hypothetical protein [Lucifera butyrica]VBB09494.1 Hypothetical protein LUCI_4789 [Lucifera butyrica]